MRSEIRLDDPASVYDGLIEKCSATANRVASTVNRLRELSNAADKDAAKATMEDLQRGMLAGVLDNQIVILAALSFLIRDMAERHAMRVQIARPGMIPPINVGGRG